MSKVKSSSGDTKHLHPYIWEAFKLGASNQGWTSSTITRTVVNGIETVSVKVYQKNL